jgi:hypothetical protein
MSFTAGAGTRCMSLLSSSPNLFFSNPNIICPKKREEEEERAMSRHVFLWIWKTNK